MHTATAAAGYQTEGVLPKTSITGHPDTGTMHNSTAGKPRLEPHDTHGHANPGTGNSNTRHVHSTFRDIDTDSRLQDGVSRLSVARAARPSVSLRQQVTALYAV